MPRLLPLLSVLSLALSCAGPEPTVCAPEGFSCHDCYDGDVVCTYGEHSAEEPSCGGCHAQAALYDALCEAGLDLTVEEADAGMVCEDLGVDTDG